MADVYHTWGEDLTWTATGDLLLVSGSKEGEQRILRRLLTNDGDYLWHLEYGAALPRRVGETSKAADLEAVTRHQILMEPAVATEPVPAISLRPFFNGAVVRIQYTDADTGQPVPVGFRLEV